MSTTKKAAPVTVTMAPGKVEADAPVAAPIAPAAPATGVTVTLSPDKAGPGTPAAPGSPPDPGAPAPNATLTMDAKYRDAADVSPARPDDAPPVRGWDRYELLELLGRGGMGAVYKARDKRLDRLVALKFILSSDPRTTKRFLQEARTQARIDHPNVCKVLEVGEIEGKAYIAMPLIDGPALNAAGAGMTVLEKAEVVKTVAEALAESHRLGIIHRDLKPSNIMLERVPDDGGAARWRPVLMDFGLAREAGDGAKGLTESGTVMGTPSYMSPEQAGGDIRHVDQRSDVYSLGATLYDLLAGVPPFTDESTANILIKVLTQDPPPLRSKAPAVPEALEIIVDRCLRKEPHRRYQTAVELAADLGRFLERRRLVARRQGLASKLYWKGRRNKPMAAVVIALFLSVVGFAGYGVRTVVEGARREAIARKRAEIAQKLGTAVKDLEWLVRSAHLVPLHDTGPEKAVVRARMADIESEMRSYGDLAAGFDHYALGRGHLALQEWDKAHGQLARAEAEGVRSPELDYALGRVLGELYRRALEDARRSGDKTYFARRKAELEQELLAPALAHLEKCRGLPTVSASYLDGLIDFYHQRYDAALANARSARKGAPWLYEAARLEGDVFMARALDAKDRGENEQAEAAFREAVARYEEAADIGRSDHEVYEALAEAWIRQEEMDMYGGRDPGAKLDKALAAADKALAAAPSESHGHTKRAFAYLFPAQYAHRHGAPRETVERLYRMQIAAGGQAIVVHPNDAYAHEITGAAEFLLAVYLEDRGAPVQELLDDAVVRLEAAIRANPKFPWAYNDYGMALGVSASSRRRRHQDPRALLEKAIAATQKATQIDDQYVVAYSNTATLWDELADWQTDHGENPEVAVREAVRMADRAIQINKKYPLAYTNAGSALTRIAAYRLDTGEDGREPARQALERFKARLAFDPRYLLALHETARTWHLLAAHERALGLDPRASLDAGDRAVEACRRVDPASADCKVVDAQLRAARGQWARRQGQSGDAHFAEAQRRARDATEKAAGRGDLWLVLAQVSLERAEALPVAGRRPILDEGLAAVARALKLAPGFPRALAVQGTLLRLQAEGERDAAAREAAEERARASLAQAFAGNPLLERRYGGARPGR